jgi:putative alpha-1,2-mannosidase
MCVFYRFILNALGLYPLSPASGDYLLGAPLFANVTVDLSGDISSSSRSKSGRHNKSSTSSSDQTTLTVVALNQGPENVYVQSVTWNGSPLEEGQMTISYSELMQGGELQFELGPSPLNA